MYPETDSSLLQISPCEISALPPECLAQLVQAVVRVHRLPLQLRRVCKVWERLLHECLPLHLFANEENAFVLSRTPRRHWKGSGCLGYEFDCRRRKLRCDELARSQILGLVRTACVDQNARGALGSLRRLTAESGICIDLHLSINVMNFVYVNYGDYWLWHHQTHAPPTGEFDDSYYKRHFDPEVAVRAYFNLGEEEGDFATLFPTLKLRSVRFEDVLPVRADFMRRILDFLVNWNPSVESIMFENHVATSLDWLPGTTTSYPDVREISINTVHQRNPGILDFLPTVFPRIAFLGIYLLLTHGGGHKRTAWFSLAPATKKPT